jgi:hypothetical protein
LPSPSTVVTGADKLPPLHGPVKKICFPAIVRQSYNMVMIYHFNNPLQAADKLSIGFLGSKSDLSVLIKNCVLLFYQ